MAHRLKRLSMCAASPALAILGLSAFVNFTGCYGKPIDPSSDDDDDSNALPLIIGFVALFLAAVGGGILWGSRRRSR